MCRKTDILPWGLGAAAARQDGSRSAAAKAATKPQSAHGDARYPATCKACIATVIPLMRASPGMGGPCAGAAHKVHKAPGSADSVPPWPVLPWGPMYGKLLMTAVVLLLAWLAIRTRLRAGIPLRASPTVRPPSGFARLLPTLAYTAVGVMVAGTGLYFYQGWQAGREAVTVRVVNANTGVAVTYRARREDVSGRSFLTLDGRRVTLAEVERLELGDVGAGPSQ